MLSGVTAPYPLPAPAPVRQEAEVLRAAAQDEGMQRDCCDGEDDREDDECRRQPCVRISQAISGM